MPIKTELTIHPDQLAVYGQVIAGLLFNSLVEISLEAEVCKRAEALSGIEAMMREGAVRLLVSLDIAAYRTEISVRVAAGGEEAHGFTHSVTTTWPTELMALAARGDGATH